MSAIILSVFSLALSVYSVIVSRRAFADALGNLMWVELRLGRWEGK